MDKSKLFDDIANKLSNSLPPELDNLKADCQKNFRAVLKNCFNKMDLVTREEFDTQTAVLAKTRAKLEALEKKVASYEKQSRSDN